MYHRLVDGKFRLNKKTNFLSNPCYVNPLSLSYSLSPSVLCPQQVKKSPISPSMYQMGSTLLRYSIESPGSPSLQQPLSLHTLLGPPGGDSEGSHSSEGSHETGDSGRYSHEEHDLANLSGCSPSPDHVTEERALHLAIELQEVTSPSTSQDS